jgi:hypothetical protein
MPVQLSFDFDQAPEDLLDVLLEDSDPPTRPDSRHLLRILTWVLEGRATIDLIDRCKDSLKLDEKTALHYLRLCRRMVRKPIVETREERVSRMVRERQHDRATALANGDYRAALAIQKDINHLLGDYPDKVRRFELVQPDKEDDAPMSLEDIINELGPLDQQELRAALAKDAP